MKVGRNSPCPCGSGRKHKKSCGSPLSTIAAGATVALVIPPSDAASTSTPPARHLLSCGSVPMSGT
ncbi:MAG TPA: SEC-C metal-binding domain-containing protein [Streptosporangiaceae bacterium]|nr:SEC-C metal-binding domain-containing protein [Streptosporangiaceae bacterium]